MSDQINESRHIQLSNKETVAAILKSQGIKEGYWALTATFNFGLMNFAQDPNGSDASPAAVSTLVGIGIEEVPEGAPFAVDASKI